MQATRSGFRKKNLAGVNRFTSLCDCFGYCVWVVAHWEAKVIALAKALSWATGIDANYYNEQLKTIAKFCGVVLFVWLLFATYGLDLSPGFF
jgi:hypothetical protein